MFSIGYAWNELRRRWSRTVVTAIGLAAGVGLVMGIVGVSDGLTQAQNKVLSPLSSVGTDIIVTRTVGATSTSSTGSTTTTTTTTPAGGFGGGEASPVDPVEPVVVAAGEEGASSEPGPGAAEAAPRPLRR